jgi:hypothetical protein
VHRLHVERTTPADTLAIAKMPPALSAVQHQSTGQAIQLHADARSHHFGTSSTHGKAGKNNGIALAPASPGLVATE